MNNKTIVYFVFFSETRHWINFLLLVFVAYSLSTFLQPQNNNRQHLRSNTICEEEATQCFVEMTDTAVSL